MIYDPIVIVIFFLLGICAWWLFFVEQQRYWLDKTRQRLFSIRDEFFNSALEGRIPFDHPAYIMTRTTLNGMIRFTHEVNVLYVLAVYAVHGLTNKQRRASDYRQRLSNAVASLSAESRNAIDKAISDAHLTILKHVMSTSPFLWPLLKPFSIVSSMLHTTTTLRTWVLRGKQRKRQWGILDAEANYIGEHG